MSAKVLFKKTITGGALAMGMVFLAAVPLINVEAAPQPINGVFIDWSTNTYAPAGFYGKLLPTSGSEVSAWVVIFVNGKPVSPSAYSIRWYIDDQLFQSGKGLNTITFKAPKATSIIKNLQARVQSPSGNLSVANIQVPIINPMVAIKSNYPGGVFTESQAKVSAIPYFFNISDPSSLSFQWSANGVTAENSENPDTAIIGLGENPQPGTTIRVQLTVTNSGDSTVATAYSNLVYK